jgi:Ser/Thr protein kinase RdoA (MazF antagonist)
MAAKTSFAPDDFVTILSQYDLGTYADSEAILRGTVQTNYVLSTSHGPFVFRYYECRSHESVLFESDLLAYLTAHNYPCPGQIRNRQGAYVGLYSGKPYVLFEFLSGEHIEHPDMHHWRQLIQQAAELQQLTQEFSSPYTPHRINYTPDVCRSLAQAEIRKLKTQNAREKFAWLSDELNTLDLPSSLPKGICHGDFHFSNVLFHNNEFVALLDFDDANQTFLQFDLVGLIEYWAWPHRSNSLDLSKARWVVQEYMKPVFRTHSIEFNIYM